MFSSSSSDEDMSDGDPPESDHEAEDSFRHSIARIIEEKLSQWKNCKMSKDTINSLTTIIYQYFTTVHAKDVEAFVNHRFVGKKSKKRKKVLVEDVLLCARKNINLQRKLKEFAKRK